MASTISITYKLQGDAKTFKELTQQAEGLKKSFNGVAVQADNLPKGLGKLKSLTGGLTKALSGLAAGAVAAGAFAKALGNAVSTMAHFERANSELASVLGKSVREIGALSDAAVDLGRQTEFTASEVTQLQTSLARLGFTEGQILSMQESVLKFAAAVGTDLASAADFSGSALRAFGLKASDSRDLLDLMAASTSKSALSFSKLQTSIATVGPVANAFGLDARDTVSLLGILSNAGFDATSAATALRNILLNLADSNGKLANGLGYTAKTMPEIIDALRDLKDRGVDLNTTLEMTDKRSVAAFNALVAGADDVRELYEELGNCSGALEDMYDTMTDNLEGAVKGLSSAWEGLTLQFRDSLEPMKGVVNWLAKLVNGMSNAVKVGVFRFGAQRTERMYSDLEAQYKDRPDELQQAIDAAQARYSGATKDRERKQAFRELYILEEIQHNQELAAAAKEAEEAVKGLADAESAEGEAAAGSKGKKKTLTDAIRDYAESVERAVQLNEVFGGKINETDARLDAMKSGLTSIIRQYGMESEAVQQLITDYNALRRARGASIMGLSSPEAMPALTGKAVSGKSGGLKTHELNLFTKATKEAMTASEAMQLSLSSLSGAFSDIARSVCDAASAWLDWIGNLLSAVAQAIPALSALGAAKRSEATANTAAMATGAGSSVASIPYVGPVLAIAAIASVLAAVANLPKFAKGGVVSGPTMALMGEYAGAQHNPEVIAPLSTLKQYIEPSGLAGEVDFRIRGCDLEGVLRKRGRKTSRS